MKTISGVATAVSILALSFGIALAEGRGGEDQKRNFQHQRQHDERPAQQHYEEHREENRHWRQGEQHEWRRGEYVDRDEWRQARYVEWREYNLSRPRVGYEWREYDGRFILAAIATGIVADIIINAR